MMKHTLMSGVAATALLFSAPAWAQRKEVTIAHQDMNVPYRIVMDSGEL
jgi:taurine transport system substrate-binding protein